MTEPPVLPPQRSDNTHDRVDTAPSDATGASVGATAASVGATGASVGGNGMPAGGDVGPDDAASARPDDLAIPRMRDVRWDEGNTRAHLTDLYGWAQRFACDAIGWYLDEKKRKSRWSRALRAFAAIFATLGGIVPLAALTIGRPDLGNWGFVLLGLAAGCVAYDRYFGYSSAWLRYVTAAMSLRTQLNDFQLSWAREMAVIGDRQPSSAEAYQLIELVRTFVGAVNGVVRDETQSWVVEFHTRLTELESKLQQNTGPSIEGSSPATSLRAAER